MNKLLKKLDLSVRLNQLEKPYLSAYLQSQADTLSRICAGRPYLLCSYYVPPELVALYNVEVLYIERVVGLFASTGLEEGGAGCSGVCSYQGLLLHLFAVHRLPPPAMILAVNYPCGDAVAACRRLSQSCRVPMVLLRKDCLENNLESVSRILENRFGRKAAPGTVAALSGEARALKQRIDRIRVQHPGILPAGDCLKLFTIENDFGTQAAVDILKLLCHTAEDRTGTYRKPAGTPVFWMGLVPLANSGILGRAEQETGCVFGYEELWMFEKQPLSADGFYAGLAACIHHNHFYRLEARLEAVLNILTQQNCRHVVNILQYNCSFLPPQSQEIERRLGMHGISCVTLNADVIRSGFDQAGLFDTLRRLVAGDAG